MYSNDHDTGHHGEPRAISIAKGYDGEIHYVALMTSIIPALAILATAISLLAAAG